MFLCLQISLISLIGSMAPLTVVARVATIANIFLFSIEHLSKESFLDGLYPFDLDYQF